VVLNDARLGIVHHAMKMGALAPIETELPPTDFVMFARSMGADGLRVEREADLGPALSAALQADGPFVVDVAVDRDEISPVITQRVESLGQLQKDRPR
jgi:acetolactate synthase-1/2/3 large subunit